MELIRSKKFQAAIIGVIVVILQHYIPALQDIDIAAVLAPILAYIIGQGLADFGKSAAASK